MKPLLGYLAHRSSVALHDAAWPLLVADDQHAPPAIWYVEEGYEGQRLYPNITLADVAPRLAAAIDRARKLVGQ